METQNEQHKRFDILNIPNELKLSIRENGFIDMTSCQEKVIPIFLSFKDVIVQSPTGTGKTLSFLIPALTLHSIYITTFILVPTRELAIQISEVVGKISPSTKCKVFIGGSDIEIDMKNIEEPFSICVATPGRIYELLKTHHKKFDKLKYLILDEADKLLDLGFYPTLLKIIGLLPTNRTTGLFSATINEHVADLSRKALRNPNNLQFLEVVPEKINIKYIKATGVEKLHVLSNILCSKSIVFFSTCASVDYFHALFTRIGYKISKLHGKINQKERVAVMQNMEDILFCTDLTARGIDFKDIKLVIHFDIPTNPSNFIHRSGRTARNNADGDVIVLLMDNEHSYSDYLTVKNIEIKEIPSIDDCSKLNEYEKRLNLSNGLISHDNELLKTYLADSDILTLSVKAFVSYVRSYKEHVLNFILNFKEVNYDRLAELHYLEKIPIMDELSNKKFTKFVRKKKEENSKKTKKKKMMGHKRR